MKRLAIVIMCLVFCWVSVQTAWAGGSRHSSDWVNFSGSNSNGSSYHYSRGQESYKSGGYGSCRGMDYCKPVFYSGLGYVAVGAANCLVSGIFAPAPAVVYPQQTVIIERPAVCYDTYYTHDHWGNPVTVRRQIPCY